MTIGISIEKQGTDYRKFYNVYYTPISSINDALDLGELLVAAEKKIHGNTVAFNKLHAWQVNATKPTFNNRTLDGFGGVISDNPTPIELCMQFEFPAANSYPSEKFYRISLNSTYLSGKFWNSSLADEVSEYLDIMVEQTPYLCNRNGVEINAPAYKGRIAVRKYNKKWYNKTVGFKSE